MLESVIKKKRSFLKWAGNKYQLIEIILKYLPSGKRLIEPFVGSGVVFLNSSFHQGLLADINPDLIHTFQFLQQEGEAFINYVNRYFNENYNTEAEFYRLRNEFNTTKNIRKKAALFVYLNRHGFNGLCRYNRSGKYNVPYGRYKAPIFPQDAMKSFICRFQNVTFTISDFENTLRQAQKGDIVYCDPPYVPLSKTSKFTSYASDSFDLNQHLKLAVLAEDLAHKGVTVLISNHDTDFTRQIYKNSSCISLDAMRNIAGKVEDRKKVKEILAIFKSKTQNNKQKHENLKSFLLQ